MTDIMGPIHLVLPDPIERAACFRALTATAGGVVRSFASADDYLDAGAAQGSAILLFQWRQPGATSGAALLRHVAAHDDIMTFVAAERLSIAESAAILRGGARDLLPAPLDPRLVCHTLRHAVAEWRARAQAGHLRREAETRLAALTPRERDILDAIAAGLGNKAIARELALSPRTVEVHRANIMRRAGTANVAELLRLRFITEYAQAMPVNSIHFGA